MPASGPPAGLLLPCAIHCGLGAGHDQAARSLHRVSCPRRDGGQQGGWHADAGKVTGTSAVVRQLVRILTVQEDKRQKR